jgi:polyisoprenoid-binding protein YceI
MARTTDSGAGALRHSMGVPAVWTVFLMAACTACVAPALADERPAGHPDTGEAATAWRFEPDDSRIDFELAALGMIGIHGRFPRFEGGSTWDPAARAWRIETRIDATSLEISPERYLSWARSSEFFSVTRHPLVVFRSDPAPESLLREGGVLTGQLVLRGVERAVRFRVAPARCQPDQSACMIDVSGEINRRQFGMESRRLTLSSQVALRLQLRAVRVDP